MAFYFAAGAAPAAYGLTKIGRIRKDFFDGSLWYEVDTVCAALFYFFVSLWLIVDGGWGAMYSLQGIRVKRILSGPDALFVATGYEDWQKELHFIVQTTGEVYGKTNQDRWVRLREETAGLIQDKIRQYRQYAVGAASF